MTWPLISHLRSTKKQTWVSYCPWWCLGCSSMTFLEERPLCTCMYLCICVHLCTYTYLHGSTYARTCILLSKIQSLPLYCRQVYLLGTSWVNLATNFGWSPSAGNQRKRSAPSWHRVHVHMLHGCKYMCVWARIWTCNARINRYICVCVHLSVFTLKSPIYIDEHVLLWYTIPVYMFSSSTPGTLFADFLALLHVPPWTSRPLVAHELASPRTLHRGCAVHMTHPRSQSAQVLVRQQ